MVKAQDHRTALLLGEEKIQALYRAKVAVIGLGGVGGYALEALARSGIGEITIIDFDKVNLSNINRQIIADHHSLGKAKTEIFSNRLRSIYPELKLHVHHCFAQADNFAGLLENADFALDAIDSVDAKIDLLEYCYRHELPIVTVFGAGRRLDPMQVRITDISKTQGCPLAKRVRKALRERGITKGIRAVWSMEEAISSHQLIDVFPEEDSSRASLGSISYMPAIMGLMASAELIKQITG